MSPTGVAGPETVSHVQITACLDQVREILQEHGETASGPMPLNLISPPARPSKWLLELWRHAEREEREAAWNRLPEDFADRLDDDWEVCKADVEFLVEKIGTRKSAPLVRAAIRSLAVLGEEIEESRTVVLPLLTEHLSAPFAYIRASVVEAIWQVGDPACLEELQIALELESDPGVREIIQHTVSILEQAHTRKEA